jgi:hypothetical protein
MSAGISDREKTGKAAHTSSNTTQRGAAANKSHSVPCELWLAEKTSLSRQRDALPWSIHPAATSDARLLELADVALGVRKPQPFRRRRLLFLPGQQH